MATQTETQRKATARKAAATRKRRNAAKRSQRAAERRQAHQTTPPRLPRPARRPSCNTLQAVQAQAERAVADPGGRRARRA